MKDGILNILKPANMTSHQVVAHVRRKLKIKKVGHTGTLDPNAMGILPICIGRATRVSEYVMDLNKKYRAEITFGISSDTGDLYGDIEVLANDFTLNSATLNTSLNKFKGKITQIPPMASAIKVAGKKLYEYHRQGKDVEIPKREVNIYDISLVNGFPIGSKTCYIDVHCSKGTYIRTLCQDIGKDLKLGALMSYLIRTEVGPFNLDNSIFLDDLTEDNYTDFLYPADFVLYKLTKVILSDKEVFQIKNGVSVLHSINNDDDLYRVYDKEDNFIAICTNNKGKLKPQKVFI